MSSLPKTLTSEYLEPFGYVIDSRDPSCARHRRLKSVKWKCSGCDVWTRPVTGINPKVCDSCFVGKKPRRLPEPASKIYRCSNRQCVFVEQVLDLIEKSGAKFRADRHDGIGGHHISIDEFPAENSLKKRQLLMGIFQMTEHHVGFRRISPC